MGAPPDKFVNDNRFCIWTQLVIVATCVTLAGVGTTADDGGQSNIPFYITGFVLASIHCANVLCKIVVLSRLKTVTKKSILHLLRSHKAAKLWNISAHAGLMWCVAGMILTGIGGVNCYTGDENNNATINLCYYDVTSDRAQVYRGLAIGLLVCHAISLVYFLFSTCAMQSVQGEIMDDPVKKVSQVQPKPETAETKLDGKPGTPAPKPSGSNGGTSAGASGSDVSPKTNQDQQIAEEQFWKTQEQKIKTKEDELKKREKRLNQRMQELSNGGVPPPPAYYEIVPGNPDN